MGDMDDLTLQQKIEMQLDRAGKAVPWILRGDLAGRPLKADEVSVEEILHGHALLIIELTRVVIELAGEIDKLRATE